MGLISGAKNVTAAGTAERLSSSSISARLVDIQAKFSNTDNVFVGDSSVGSGVGTTLSPGASTSLGTLQRWFVLDLNEIWINSAVDGEGVIFNYWPFP